MLLDLVLLLTIIAAIGLIRLTFDFRPCLDSMMRWLGLCLTVTPMRIEPRWRLRDFLAPGMGPRLPALAVLRLRPATPHTARRAGCKEWPRWRPFTISLLASRESRPA